MLIHMYIPEDKTRLIVPTWGHDKATGGDSFHPPLASPNAKLNMLGRRASTWRLGQARARKLGSRNRVVIAGTYNSFALTTIGKLTIGVDLDLTSRIHT